MLPISIEEVHPIGMKLKFELQPTVALLQTTLRDHSVSGTTLPYQPYLLVVIFSKNSAELCQNY